MTILECTQLTSSCFPRINAGENALTRLRNDTPTPAILSTPSFMSTTCQPEKLELSNVSSTTEESAGPEKKHPPVRGLASLKGPQIGKVSILDVYCVPRKMYVALVLQPDSPYGRIDEAEGHIEVPVGSRLSLMAWHVVSNGGG